MYRLAISLLLMSLALQLACGSSEEAEDIVIGIIVPSVSVALDTTITGVSLAADEINAAGGIDVDGRKHRIRLAIENSEGRPETALAKAIELINLQRAVALVGVPVSFNAIPVAKAAEQRRTPMLSTLSTHPETTAGKRYAFRLSFLNSFQGKVLADFAYQDLGARRAAVLVNSANQHSTDLAEVFERVFRQHGGEVHVEHFLYQDPDLSGQLERIAADDVDVVLLVSFTDIVHKIREAGIEATILGSDSWHRMDPAVYAGAGVSYFSDIWAPDYPNPRSSEFIANYRRAYGETPTTAGALAYDALSVIAEVIRRQGSFDPDAIRAGLASLDDFVGVSGDIRFSGSGDPRRTAFIRRVDDDGTISFYKEVEP